MPPTLASDPDLLPGMIFLTLIVWSIVFILVTYWRMIMTLEDDWAAMDSGDAWLPAGWREKRRHTGAGTHTRTRVGVDVKKDIVAMLPGPRNLTCADKKDEHVRNKDLQNGKSARNVCPERTNIPHHAIPNIPTPENAHAHSQHPLHRIHTTQKVEAWMHECPTPKDQRCPHHHTHFDEECEENEEETQDELDAPSSTSLDKTESAFSAGSSSGISEGEKQEALQSDENANVDALQKDGDVDVDGYDSSETSTDSSNVVYTPPESDPDSL